VLDSYTWHRSGWWGSLWWSNKGSCQAPGRQCGRSISQERAGRTPAAHQHRAGGVSQCRRWHLGDLHGRAPCDVARRNPVLEVIVLIHQRICNIQVSFNGMLTASSQRNKQFPHDWSNDAAFMKLPSTCSRVWASGIPGTRAASAADFTHATFALGEACMG
jgi:hypothetical protein